jgi:hypothetical protein
VRRSSCAPFAARGRRWIVPGDAVGGGSPTVAWCSMSPRRLRRAGADAGNELVNVLPRSQDSEARRRSRWRRVDHSGQVAVAIAVTARHVSALRMPDASSAFGWSRHAARARPYNADEVPSGSDDGQLVAGALREPSPAMLACRTSQLILVADDRLVCGRRGRAHARVTASFARLAVTGTGLHSAVGCVDVNLRTTCRGTDLPAIARVQQARSARMIRPTARPDQPDQPGDKPDAKRAKPSQPEAKPADAPIRIVRGRVHSSSSRSRSAAAARAAGLHACAAPRRPRSARSCGRRQGQRADQLAGR